MTTKKIKIEYLSPEEYIRQELAQKIVNPDEYLLSIPDTDGLFKLMELYGNYVFIKSSEQIIQKLEEIKNKIKS